MAFALYLTNVPDGSEKNSCGPSSSSYPARSSATPKGLDMRLEESPSCPSPNDSARSHTAVT
jgi:hypothetical protein